MTDLTLSQFASKDDLLAAQAARIAELESQLEAIGAGGVEPLRKPAAAPQAVQAAVPDGWQMVPAKPTEAMVGAIMSEGEVDAVAGLAPELRPILLERAGIAARYTAMLAAAPAHPAEAVPAQAAVPEGWKLAPIKVPDSAFAWVSGGYPAGYKAWDERDTAVVHERAQRAWEAILNGITAPAHPAEGVPVQAATTQPAAQGMEEARKERDTIFFLAGWNGCSEGLDANAQFKKAALAAQAKQGGAANG